MEAEVERPETVSEKNFLKFEDGNSSSSNAAVYVSEELKVAPDSSNISSETAMEGTAKSVGEGITSFSEGEILVEPPSHVDVVMKENGETPKMDECIKSTVSIENEPLENEDLSQNLDISDVGDENREIVKHDQSLEAKESSEDKNPATDDLGEKDNILSIIKASEEPSIETIASYETAEKNVEIKDVKPSPHTIQLLDEETNLQKDISESEKPQEACEVTSEEKNLKDIEMCEISLQNEELDSEVGKISELASQSPISCGSKSAEKEISNASSSGLSLTVDAEKLTATNLEEQDAEVTDVGEDMVKDDLNEKHITHVTPVNVIPAEEISEYHERFELEEKNSEENKMGRGTDGESKNEEIEIPTVQKNACGPGGSLANATKLEEQNAEVTDMGEGTVKDIISDGQIPTIQAKELPEDNEELESEEVNTESVDLGEATVNHSGNAEKEIPTEVQSDAFASGPNPDTDAEKLTETKLEDQNTKATDMYEVIVKDDFNDGQIPRVEPVAKKGAKEILHNHEGFEMEEQNSKETDMGEGKYDNRKKAEMEIPTEVQSDACTSSESLANDAARTTATILEEQNIEAADMGTVKDGSNDEQISAFPVDKLSEAHEQSELEEQNAEAVDVGLEIEDSKNAEQESPTAPQSDPSASGLSPEIDAENLTATKLEEQNTELANVKESIVKDVFNDEQIPHVAPVTTIPPVDINVESVTEKDALHEEEVPHVGPVTKISAEETSGVHKRYDVVEDNSFETRNEREEEAPEVNGNQPDNLDDPYVALEAQELPMQKEEIEESASMATEVVAEEKINSEVHETENSSKRTLNEEETQSNDFGNLCAVQDPREVSAETDEASKEVESEQLTRTSDVVSNSAAAESSADSEATPDENDINDKSPVLQSEEPQHEIIVGREINEDDIQIENEVQDNDQEASFVSEAETESETKAQLQNKVEHDILEEPSLMASKNIEETSQDETQGESSGETESTRTEILEVDNPVSGELNKVGTPHVEYEEVILETNETDGDFERKTSDEKNQAENKIMLASALSSDEEITPREDSGKEIEEPIGRATEEQNPVKPESIEDVNLHASSMVPSTPELHFLEEETESEKISLSEISHEVPYAEYREDGTEDLKQKMEERIQEENKDEGHEASSKEPAEWNPDSHNDTTEENPISIEENLDNGGGHLPVTHALLARAFVDENTDEKPQHIKDSSLVDEPIYETTHTKDDRGIDAFKVEMVPEKIERALEPKDQVEVEPEEIERTSKPEDHDLKNTEEINEETSLEGSGIVVSDHDHEIVEGNIEMAAATENSKVEILDNDESDQKRMDQPSLSRDSVEEEREQENPRETYEAVTTKKENPISVELGSKPHMAHIEDDNMLAQNIDDLPVSQVLLKYVSVEGTNEIEEAHVGKQMREQNPDMILEEPSIIESKAFNIDTENMETNTKESAIINVKTVSIEDSKFSERFHEYETEQMSADQAAQERSLGSIKNETPDDKAAEEPTDLQLSDIKIVASVENVEKLSAKEDVATPEMMKSSNENEEIEDNGRLDKDLDASPVTMDCEKEATLKDEDEASAKDDKILQKIDYSQEVSPSPTEPTEEEERDDRGLNPLTVEIEPEKIERAFGPHVQGEVEPEEIERASKPEDHDLKNIEEINEETTLAGGNMVVSNHDQAIVRENIEMAPASEYPEVEILVSDESQQNKMDQLSRDSIEEEKEQENPKDDCQEQQTIEESKQVESAIFKDNKTSDPVVGKSSQMEENKDLGEHHEMDYQERDSATLEAHNVLDEETSKEINLEEPVLFNDDSSYIENEMDMKDNHANKLEETCHVKENDKKDLEERAGKEEPDDQNSEEIQNVVNPISVEENPDKGGGHLPVTHALFAGAFADENTDADATEDSSVVDEPTFETLNTNDDRGINALNMEMEPEKIERAFEPKDQVEMEPEEIKRASEHEDHDLKNIEKINEDTTLEGGDMVVSNHDQAIVTENIEMVAATEYPKVEILVNDESHQNAMDQLTLSSASFEEEKEQENPKEDSQEQETIEESKQVESAISKDNKTSDPVVGESSQMEETKDLGEHHGIDHKEKDSVTLEAHDLLDKEASKEANTLDAALSNDEASKIEEKEMEGNNANKLEENIHVKESEEKDLEKNAGLPEPDDQNSEAVTADGEDPISVELGQRSSMAYVEDDDMLAQNIDHLPVSEVLLRYMSVEETSKEQTDEIAEVQSVGKQITVLNPDMILEESSIIESEAFNKGIKDIENDTKESAITNDTTVSIENAEFSETFHEYETEPTSSNQAAQERLLGSNKSEISADKISNIADQAEVEPSVENVATPEIDSITTGYVMVGPQDVESETAREEAEPESITGSKSDGSHKIMKDENTDIKVEDTKLACVEHDLEASPKTTTEISEFFEEEASAEASSVSEGKEKYDSMEETSLHAEGTEGGKSKQSYEQLEITEPKENNKEEISEGNRTTVIILDENTPEGQILENLDANVEDTAAAGKGSHTETDNEDKMEAPFNRSDDEEFQDREGIKKIEEAKDGSEGNDQSAYDTETIVFQNEEGLKRVGETKEMTLSMHNDHFSVIDAPVEKTTLKNAEEMYKGDNDLVLQGQAPNITKNSEETKVAHLTVDASSPPQNINEEKMLDVEGSASLFVGTTTDAIQVAQNTMVSQEGNYADGTSQMRVKELQAPSQEEFETISEGMAKEKEIPEQTSLGKGSPRDQTKGEDPQTDNKETVSPREGNKTKTVEEESTVKVPDYILARDEVIQESFQGDTEAAPKPQDQDHETYIEDATEYNKPKEEVGLSDYAYTQIAAKESFQEDDGKTLNQISETNDTKYPTEMKVLYEEDKDVESIFSREKIDQEISQECADAQKKPDQAETDLLLPSKQDTEKNDANNSTDVEISDEINESNYMDIREEAAQESSPKEENEGEKVKDLDTVSMETIQEDEKGGKKQEAAAIDLLDPKDQMHVITDAEESSKVKETHAVFIGERIPEQSFLENEKEGMMLKEGAPKSKILEEIHDTKDASEIDNPYGKVKDSIELIKHETIESFQGNEKESNQLEETTPEFDRGQSYATDIQDTAEISISNEEVEVAKSDFTITEPNLEETDSAMTINTVALKDEGDASTTLDTSPIRKACPENYIEKDLVPKQQIYEYETSNLHGKNLESSGDEEGSKELIDDEKLETNCPGEEINKEGGENRAEVSRLVSESQIEDKIILHNVHEDELSSNMIIIEPEAVKMIPSTDEAVQMIKKEEENKLDKAPDFMAKEESQAKKSSNENEEMKEKIRVEKDPDASLKAMYCGKEVSLNKGDEPSATDKEISQKIDYSQKVSFAIAEEEPPMKRDDLIEDEDLQSVVQDPVRQALNKARLEDQVLLQKLKSGLEVKGLEIQEESQAENVKESLTEEQEVMDTDRVQLSDLLINSKGEMRETAETDMDEHKKEIVVTQEEEEKSGEEKEDNGGGNNKTEESGSDAPLLVKTRDLDIKPAHKKSHGVLSGVGSKVKHSIGKVKKIITGKSSQSKQPK